MENNEIIVQMTAFDYEDEHGKESLTITFDIDKSEIKEAINSRIFKLGNYFLLKAGKI